jgi:zinc protease
MARCKIADAMKTRVIQSVTAAIAALAAASAAAQTSPAAAPRLHVPYTQFTLANGLRVILHEDHKVPVVSVNVWYHVGSARERTGRTGFAHLFEHLMFEGSRNVSEGEFDRLLEAAGGENNGSTTGDRTNYYINVPSSALELALFLESDRMAYLLDIVTPELVDGQRDVVKNERRQSYENEPYGMASIELDRLLYPEGHPYSWPTIGHMEDLTAATYADVIEFHKRFYGPGNASLSIAGDIDSAATRALVEKWFGEIERRAPVDPIHAPPAVLHEVRQKTLHDKVQLPRIYLAWLTPAVLTPGDAELDLAASILTGGKNSRLYRRLVYEMQIAQDVSAFQSSADLVSAFLIVATARPGHTVDELKAVIDEELDRLRRIAPEPRELERAVNAYEASFYARLERVGGFGGKADLLNAYSTRTGMPDYFAEDLSRYHAASPADVQSAVERYLPPGRRVELTVVPEGAAR